ncbi:MAG: hypothetical protein ACP5RN_02375 [Armatimonadota bacterium]
MTIYPTLIIGSGKIATQTLEQTARLLRCFRSPVEHVVSIGIYEAGEAKKLHVPPVDVPDWFVNPLAEWMYRIRVERNLERVRKAGISIGPIGGYLVVQILLLVDSDQTDSVPEIVHLLEEASVSLQEKVPPRLHLLVVHPHPSAFSPTVVGDPSAFVRTGSLTFSSTWILAPVRSDGSVLTLDDLETALPHFLFASLQPIDHYEKHWLFRKPPSADKIWLVPGFGLVVLPLPEIEDALTHQLLADAFTELTSEPETTPEVDPEIQQDEVTWWQRLLQAIPNIASQGAGLTLSLAQDKPKLSGDPHQWLQETDDWDAHWRKETLPQCEQAMLSAANEMLEVFRSYLRQYIQNNMLVFRGALPILRFALDKAAQAMDRWTILKMELSEPGGETVQSARTRFEEALERLPERGRLITIATLVTLVSWAVLQGALWLLAPRLGVYVWWAVVVAAVLPPVLAGGWAYAFYRRRKAYLQECWDDYLGRLHAQHAEMLRWRALHVLQNTAQEMKDVITDELQRAQQLQQDINTRISLWRHLAHTFRVMLPFPLRAIVSNWKHIQPIVQELWGRRDLTKVLRKGLEELGISTLVELQERTDDVAQYLRHQLLDHWMTPEHRQSAYYLRLRFGNEEALRQWLDEQMSEAAHEAAALLWRCEQPAQQGWKLFAEGLPMLNGITPGVPHGDETLVLPNVFGRICVGQTDTP